MDISIENKRTNLEAARHAMPAPLRVGIRQWVRRYRLPIFTSCCALITLIGILDTWLVIKYSNSIFEMEENPICLFLIEQDPYGMMVFVYGKAMGLIVVNSVLIGLFRYWYRAALAVTFAVTMFQVSLLSYLYVLSDIPHLCRIYLN